MGIFRFALADEMNASTEAIRTSDTYRLALVMFTRHDSDDAIHFETSGLYLKFEYVVGLIGARTAFSFRLKKPRRAHFLVFIQLIELFIDYS